jgi:GxxExxY protein
MALIIGRAYSPVTNTLIGCAMRVHTALGPGLLEKPYQGAFALEMTQAGLAFELQVRLPVEYHKKVLNRAYLMDFVVEALVVVELKAVTQAQLTSYLGLSGYPAGLLLNFNVKSMRHGIVRILNDRSSRPSRTS